jgi:alkylation response protein AidB-like acyl-CoA dehydrogenase
MTQVELPPGAAAFGEGGGWRHIMGAGERYAEAATVDLLLGDPRDPGNPFGFAAMVSRDAAEGFPVALAARLAPRLALAAVPAEHGGDLTTVDETLMATRVAARRDVTVMPATMFSITAASCVLLSGTPAQQARVVELLRAGRAVGFALSEAEHGSDLLANECLLVPVNANGGVNGVNGDSGDPDGLDGAAGVNGAGGGPAGRPAWRLTGEKWLVGLGDRCEALVVVANSGGRGPAAFSAVLLAGEPLRDARAGAYPAWQRPTGMRGIDFASFRFDDTPVLAADLLGQRGRGMETAMKAMQYVRIMSTAANLACGDTGLRLTMDFAAGHRVAGKTVLEHAAPRRELATAATMLLALDATALSTARAVHVLPTQANLHSSIAKKVCTDGSEELLARCGDVLGSRSVLRDGPLAAYEVARRDNAMVRFIDTSPVANARLVAMQLHQWAQGYNPRPDEFAGAGELARVFNLDAELPPLRLAELELSGRGRDAVTAGLPRTAGYARAALAGGDRALLRVAALEMAVDGLRRDVLRTKERLGAAFGGSVELLDLADRFCWLHAAASCLHLWWFNRRRALYGEPPGGTSWLCAVLGLLVDRAHGGSGRCDTADTDAALEVTGRLHAAGRLFSAVPLQLAEGAAATGREAS